MQQPKAKKSFFRKSVAQSPSGLQEGGQSASNSLATTILPRSSVSSVHSSWSAGSRATSGKKAPVVPTFACKLCNRDLSQEDNIFECITCNPSKSYACFTCFTDPAAILKHEHHKSHFVGSRDIIITDPDWQIDGWVVRKNPLDLIWYQKNDLSIKTFSRPQTNVAPPAPQMQQQQPPAGPIPQVAQVQQQPTNSAAPPVQSQITQSPQSQPLPTQPQFSQVQQSQSPPIHTPSPPIQSAYVAQNSQSQIHPTVTANPSQQTQAVNNPSLQSQAQAGVAPIAQSQPPFQFANTSIPPPQPQIQNQPQVPPYIQPQQQSPPLQQPQYSPPAVSTPLPPGCAANDDLIHDAAWQVPGWIVRKTAAGLVWYESRETGVKTYERPQARPQAQPQVQPQVQPQRSTSQAASSVSPVSQRSSIVSTTSNNWSEQDDVIHDEAWQVPGWVVRKTSAGIVWYENRQTKLRTYQRPQPAKTRPPILTPIVTPIQRSNTSASSIQTQSGGWADTDDYIYDDVWQVPGWHVRKTPSNIIWYENKETKVRTWKRPDPSTANSQQRPGPSIIQSQPKPQVAKLPSGWTESKDPNGRVFYTNTVTKASTWERPVEAPVKVQRTLPPGWEQRKDPNGRAFYYNASTQQTTWKFPGSSSSASSTPPTRVASEPTMQASVTSPGTGFPSTIPWETRSPQAQRSQSFASSLNSPTATSVSKGFASAASMVRNSDTAQKIIHNPKARRMATKFGARIIKEVVNDTIGVDLGPITAGLVNVGVSVGANMIASGAGNVSVPFGDGDDDDGDDGDDDGGDADVDDGQDDTPDEVADDGADNFQDYSDPNNDVGDTADAQNVPDSTSLNATTVDAGNDFQDTSGVDTTDAAQASSNDVDSDEDGTAGDTDDTDDEVDGIPVDQSVTFVPGVSYDQSIYSQPFVQPYPNAQTYPPQPAVVQPYQASYNLPTPQINVELHTGHHSNVNTHTPHHTHAGHTRSVPADISLGAAPQVKKKKTVKKAKAAAPSLGYSTTPAAGQTIVPQAQSDTGPQFVVAHTVEVSSTDAPAGSGKANFVIQSEIKNDAPAAGAINAFEVTHNIETIPDYNYVPGSPSSAQILCREVPAGQPETEQPSFSSGSITRTTSVPSSQPTVNLARSTTSASEPQIPAAAPSGPIWGSGRRPAPQPPSEAPASSQPNNPQHTQQPMSMHVSQPSVGSATGPPKRKPVGSVGIDAATGARIATEVATTLLHEVAQTNNHGHQHHTSITNAGNHSGGTSGTATSHEVNVNINQDPANLGGNAFDPTAFQQSQSQPQPQPPIIINNPSYSTTVVPPPPPNPTPVSIPIPTYDGSDYDPVPAPLFYTPPVNPNTNNPNPASYNNTSYPTSSIQYQPPPPFTQVDSLSVQAVDNTSAVIPDENLYDDSGIDSGNEEDDQNTSSPSALTTTTPTITSATATAIQTTDTTNIPELDSFVLNIGPCLLPPSPSGSALAVDVGGDTGSVNSFSLGGAGSSQQVLGAVPWDGSGS